MNARTLAAVCCAGAILAGCAGRTASPLPDAAGSLLESASQAQTKTPEQLTPMESAMSKSAKANLTIVVSIPRSTAPSPRYISPGAKGMTLAFKGPEERKEAFGLTHSTDPRCKNAEDVTICAFTLQLRTGKYTVNVALFDQPPVNRHIPASAKLLSLANDVPLTMKDKANRLKVRPAGVVASLAISGIPSGTAGTAFASAQSFTVTAEDADGYVIVGPYENAATLSDSDTTGATAIATSGSDNPPAGELLSSSDTATLNYTGLAIVPATITASASAATNGTGSFAPALQPIDPATLTGGVPINAYQAASPVTFSVSEVGWTNSPYDRTLSATLSSACNTFVTVTPASGTTFTPELVASPTNGGACTLTLTDGVGQQLVIPLGYELFSYTGSAQSFIVPSGVTQVTITALGAQGANYRGGTAGLGASVTATVGITAGTTLYVYVGSSWDGVGAFNNGIGSTGGGASDVRTSDAAPLTGISSTDPRILVAGGGGASGFDGYSGGNGGAAKGSGESGGSTTDGGGGGGGGTQTGPGAAGTSTCTMVVDGAQGTPGVGGFGANSGAGDGGGGWWGGSGGGIGSSCVGGAGGGGGSSFVTSGATNVSSAAGGSPNENGQITITW
jgi:hypothetical protein